MIMPVQKGDTLTSIFQHTMGRQDLIYQDSFITYLLTSCDCHRRTFGPNNASSTLVQEPQFMIVRTVGYAFNDGNDEAEHSN